MVRVQEPRELLALRRMAARLGVPSRWLREQAEAGSVPGLKAGERWLFRPDVAAEVIAKMAAPVVKRQELDSSRVLNLMAACDGRSILSPAEMVKLGLPEEIANQLTEVFKSDPTEPGGTIYSNGEPVAEFRGIHDLDVLKWLTEEVGADVSSVKALGRGIRASQYKDAIRDAIGGEQ